MGGTTLERSNFTQSALITAVTLAALMLLVAVLAYWTWAWFAPRPAPRARAVEAAPRVDAAHGLFGGARQNRSAPAPTGLSITLLGVAAASGGRTGYAVIQLEADKILAVREGMEIAPGIRLAEVHAQQVVLERNGALETLALPEKNGGARETGALPAPGAPAQARAQRSRN